MKGNYSSKNQTTARYHKNTLQEKKKRDAKITKSLDQMASSRVLKGIVQ